MQAKNLATWGRIQRDERWWWSASNEECHLLLSHWNPFIPSSRKATASPQTRHFSCGQKESHLRSHSRRRKMTMIYFKKRVSSFADSLKSLYVIFHADKNLATWGRIQRDWRKMMMICFKWRVSSFAVSLKSLYPFIPESNRKSPNTSFFMRTKRKPPEVAFKATKDDDDLFQKKSVIFCWLTEVTLCHFSCGQKPSHLRSHSRRRKMTMIYFKKRVSSFADSLKSLYAMSSRGLQNEINGFLNCLKKVFSSCRIHLRTAIPDRELQHPRLCHFTKPIQIRIDTHSLSNPVWLQNYNTKPQCHSHAKCKWCYNIWGGTGWFNYKALDEPYKAHFARTCIRPEVNWLLFIRLIF